MLNNIKLLLGITDSSKDELLNLLIEQSQEEAVNYTNNEDIASLKNAILSMVVFKYNRLGSEGVDRESYSGVTFDYSSDYPDSIIRELKAHRRMGVF